MLLETQRPTRLRAGFTLIEILVVVAILAILTALVAAGIGKVKNGQLSRNTEGTVTKLQQALDTQWKTVIDQCRKDSRGITSSSAAYNSVLTFCGNDSDRAMALWTYLNLKREFPQSFLEAINPVVLLNPTSGQPVVILLPRATFASVAVLPTVVAGGVTTSTASTAGLSTPGGVSVANQPVTTGIGTDEAESAILLFLALSEKASSGANFASDDAMKGAQTSLGTFRVFTDAWGAPIKFIRFANPTIASEIAQPPYLGSSADPIDTVGKLANAIPGTAWTPAQKAAALQALNFISSSSTVTGPNPAVSFGENKLPTVVAAGQKALGNGPAFQGSNFDDYFGYRYRRQGNK